MPRALIGEAAATAAAMLSDASSRAVQSLRDARRPRARRQLAFEAVVCVLRATAALAAASVHAAWAAHDDQTRAKWLPERSLRGATVHVPFLARCVPRSMTLGALCTVL